MYQPHAISGSIISGRHSVTYDLLQSLRTRRWQTSPDIGGRRCEISGLREGVVPGGITSFLDEFDWGSYGWHCFGAPLWPQLLKGRFESVSTSSRGWWCVYTAIAGRTPAAASLSTPQRVIELRMFGQQNADQVPGPALMKDQRTRGGKSPKNAC